MRLISLLTLPALAVSLASAQAPSAPAKKPATTGAAAKPAAAKPATAAHTAPGACVQVPQLSPKVPALPPGSPCAKALYTITTTPNSRIDYINPIENTDLLEFFGLHPTTFTLAYIDAKVGTGPLAGPHQYYSIQYTGYLVDGTKFDSSYDHTPVEPITIPYGARKVIPGWDTGFAGMRVGGKRRLFIPFELAYGNTGSGPIPAKAELVFDVELVSVSDTPPAPPTPPAATKPAQAPIQLNTKPPAGATGTFNGSAPANSAPAAKPAAPPSANPAKP